MGPFPGAAPEPRHSSQASWRRTVTRASMGPGARFLTEVPGCFVFLGNGNSAPLQNPSYDFNDEGLLHGARFHAAVVRRRLPVG